MFGSRTKELYRFVAQVLCGLLVYQVSGAGPLYASVPKEALVSAEELSAVATDRESDVVERLAEIGDDIGSKLEGLLALFEREAARPVQVASISEPPVSLLTDEVVGNPEAKRRAEALGLSPSPPPVPGGRLSRPSDLGVVALPKAVSPDVPLLPGFNLVSLPNEPTDPSPAAVLAPIAGQHGQVFAYDACDAADPWKVYDPANPGSSDLTAIDHTQGLWIDADAATVLPVEGAQPPVTDIPLCTGWNLVGYPLGQPRPVLSALASIRDQLVRVFGFASADAVDPWEVWSAGVPAWANDLDLMLPGRGYWVLVTEDVTLRYANEGQQPLVEITTPADLGEVMGPTEVVGTVRSDLLDQWTLSYRPAGETGPFTEIASANVPVEAAPLGVLDPTLLLNGLYEVRLEAVDFQGLSVEDTIAVSVDGGMKLGHFSLSFVDLAIPLAGLDLDVVRTYDSRDKRQGDFGFGWTLDIRQGSYDNNRPPGEGWRIDAGFLPCQNVVETKSHVATIRLSDREVYRFRPRLFSPAPTLGGCFAEARFDFVDGPVPGATLQILGGTSVFWANGSDQVIEIDEFEPFEPAAVRLTTRDGRVFDLSLTAGVTSLAEPNGNRITITPGGIQHSAGVTINFERDAQGRIVRIVDPLGRALLYGYDVDGDLVLFTDRDGHETRFTYLADHYLEDVVDARGVRAVRSEFDADGRLVKVIDAAGNETTFDRDLDARREVVTDRLGNSRVLEYDTRGNVVREVDGTGQVTQRSFDANDNLLSETDPLGNTTTFTYSAANDLLSLRDPLGNETHFTYNAAGDVLTITDPRGNVLESTYDSQGNLLRMTDPSGAATVFTYDSQGNVLTETDALGQVTTRSYDGRGNLVREVDPLGVETTYTYNAIGDRLTEATTRTTPTGVETLVIRYTYDGAGQIVGRTFPDGSTYSTSYDGRGNVTQSVDPLGRTTHYTYDAAGRAGAVTYPDGTSETRVYDAEGNLVASTDRAGRVTAYFYDAALRPIRTVLPDGSTLEKTYDAAGRLASTTDPGGRTTTFTYDAAGRQVGITDALGQTTSATFDEAGNRLAVTDPAGHTTRFEYDGAGRPTRTVFPDGSAQQMAYDTLGRVVSTTDPAGMTTEYEHDAAGRLLQVKDALGAITRYAWDEQGNLVSQTDALGRVTRFEVDAMGRRTKRVLPDGAAETWTYDAAGNPVMHADFAGRTTRNVYDANDHLLERIYPDSSRVTLSYTATGRRASVVDARGTTSYSYDARDRLVELTIPDGRRLTYAYDAAGNRTALTAHVAGQALTTTYAYDPLDRLTTVTDPDGGVYGHTYDANGNRTSLTQPNGTTTTYAYDSLNRLLDLTTVDAAATVLQSYAYTLDPAGRRTRVEEHGGTVRVHGFDVLGRLVGETVSNAAGLVYDNTFGYDPVGNRLSRSHTAADGTVTATASTFDVRDRLQTLDAQAWTWDPNGNLTAKSGEADYAWDFEDRLQEVTLADGTVVRNLYDVDGIRVRTETTPPGGPTEAVDYLVDTSVALPQVIAESGASGLGAYYVRGDDLLAVIRLSGTRYYHADGQMSVRLLTDENALVTDRYDYEAFGTLFARQGSDPNPFLFTGEAFDPNVGFAYHRARWMDPRVGRFASMDPFAGRLAEPVTLHKYLYAGNDPVDLADPTGLFFSGGITGLVASMAIGAIINGIFAAIFSNHSPGTKEFWGDVGKGALIGALTAPVGGLFAKVLAPIARLTIRPLLSLLGRISSITLRGRGPAGQMLVRISRYFFNTNKAYPRVNSTFFGRTLQRLFPNVRWEQHHVFIQQAWSRVGGPNQLFDDLAANEGLRRMGNGLWNLLPIPRSLNAALGRSVIGTQMFATAYYSILVYGPWHTLVNFFGD